MIKGTKNYSAVRWEVNDGTCICYFFVGKLRFTTANGNEKRQHGLQITTKGPLRTMSLCTRALFLRGRCRRGYGQRRRRRTGSLVSDTVNLAPPLQAATVVTASAHMRRSRPRLASLPARDGDSCWAMVEMFAFADGTLYGQSSRFSFCCGRSFHPPQSLTTIKAR